MGQLEPKMIYVGCGHHRMAGFIHVEINPGKNKSGYPDILADISEYIPLPDDFADLVYSCDTMEHLAYSQFINCLLETHRILKKGGFVRMVTPDLDQFVKDYSDKIYEADRKATLDMPNENYVDTFVSRIMYFDHRYNHTFDTIKRALEKTGFEDIRICRPGDSKIEQANQEILPSEISHKGELIVEAVKGDRQPLIKKMQKKHSGNFLKRFMNDFLNIDISAYNEHKPVFPRRLWFVGLFFNKRSKKPWLE